MATQINSNLSNWSAIAASNQPDGTDSPDLDADLRQIQAVVRQYMRTKGTDMASAATLDLATADGDYIDVTGTTGPITSLGTVSAGMRFILQFDDAVALTHSANLVLPGAANLTTAAGDHLWFESLGGGAWRCLLYFPSSGLAKSTSPVITTPDFKGEVQMQTAAGSTYLTFPNSNSIATTADIVGADANIGISSLGSAHVFLDADNSGTGSKFKVWANGAGTGTATEVFSVDETGAVVAEEGTFAAGLVAQTVYSSEGLIGYATGAGSTTTQLTNKSTAVTLDAVCGTIVTHDEEIADGAQKSFTWNNTYFATGEEVVIMNVDAGTNAGYVCNIEMTGVGSCTVQLRNVSGGALSEALTLRFAVIRAVAS